MKAKQPILIIMAMQGEALRIVESLKLRPIESPFYPLPTIGYRGPLNGSEIVMLINGIYPVTKVDMIGTQVAAATTALGIREYNPSVIFNFGTCGGLQRKGARIADLYLCCDRVWFHTRRIPVPGWEELGWGGNPTAGTSEIAKRLNFKVGILSTTDSLDHPPIDAERFRKVDADVADMEGGSIAMYAHLYKIPFYSLKGVTDLMDPERVVGEQFLENFEKVVHGVTVGAVELLEDYIKK